MKSTVFAFTPPFTQLNTPYPATAYLKGFLNTKNVSCFQADLGIEVILEMFSKKGLGRIFDQINRNRKPLSSNCERIVNLQDEYIQTIEAVILFLQGKNPTLADRICQENFLPQASRFDQLEEDLGWAFGTMGVQDKAKHLATLYLEDLSDLITECLDPHFGFSRYAERLGRSANSFDELYGLLEGPLTYVDQLLVQLLQEKLALCDPKLVVISVPFPGNLYASLRAGQYIKANFPQIKVAMGGGFANTELRSLSDPRVFEFYDFVCLDDGELPLECLVRLVENPMEPAKFKRTFLLEDGIVKYKNDCPEADYKQNKLGTPNYSDLLLDRYISVIELANPMHRLWSDGRWNKLTLAHGCYWGKCTFCDISLDYIKVYEPLTASLICDRIEEIIAQTGQTGFHFVDEAAPPALMRALALEILKRRLVISWWTNIRFEKSFSHDLCQLLAASGCIAVSGGLEVASDRLLELIQKGVTVAQVAKVCQHFTEAGIMVHAYLMYGFPSQTAQETIDSLEMVRQMFEQGILQSAYWHQFAMTAHSPVGLNPEAYKTKLINYQEGAFANNDLVFEDLQGTDHEKFSFGLKKSLFNYMHGLCFEFPLQEWFEFKVPRTQISANYIADVLNKPTAEMAKPLTKMVFLGKAPQIATQNAKKGNIAELTFFDKKEVIKIKLPVAKGEWLQETLKEISAFTGKTMSFQDLKKRYEVAGFEHFEMFWYNKPVNNLKDIGLLELNV